MPRGSYSQSVVMFFLRLISIGMLLVNVSVFSKCCSKTLLGWTIQQSDDDRLSLADFYRTVVFTSLYDVILSWNLRVNDIHNNG